MGVDPGMGSGGSRTAGEKQCETHIITCQILKAFKCVELNSKVFVASSSVK